MSNFVFHEVKSVKDKREVLKEALRVVKKDGAFSFQDLFQVKRCYGDLDSLLQELRDSGIREVRFTDTHPGGVHPRLSERPFFMLGSIGDHPRPEIEQRPGRCFDKGAGGLPRQSRLGSIQTHPH